MIKTTMLAIMLSISLSASAEDNYSQAIVKTVPTIKYATSAMLKKNGDDSTIKLVQSIEVSSSREEAVGMLFAKIRNDFPGYSVLDSIVTPIQKDKQVCDFKV